MRPTFKCHGGKYYLWTWIVCNFPGSFPQMRYVENYIGGGSVFLNKWPSQEEVINDIDPEIMAIYLSVKNNLREFQAELRSLSYSEETFNKALRKELSPSVNEYVLRRMSRGGLRESFGWSDRTRGGQPGDVNAWATAITELASVHHRLWNCTIENMPSLELIQKYDSKNTLFYCDPPYLHATRVSTSAYKYEMTHNDHVELGRVLNQVRGKVVLSGYPSKLYSEIYGGWRSISKMIVNHSSQKDKKESKEEVLWLNF